ncbi:hypothetical protein [Dyadobacter arcticus]|uniref:Uncharacterized protein n=1 Tax=Dyadobacter arcticus TaxID=1078754 RepID=A0ABX0UL38_9BACT|nr:hypothetical protein [Dyadobacter arcticus]NIJ52335.1 hypothetical protein [Dyadobacter arcticus]
MIVTAYQTLEDKDNLDEIETEGPFKCTRSDAWLGYGFYFWDTNMKWAIAWGENSYTRRGKGYVVGRCEVDLSNRCFDLHGNVAHQLELKEIIEVLKRSGKFRTGNRLILSSILEFLKNEGLFEYKSIRIGDNNDPLKIHFTERRGEFMVINQRVHICVIERKDVILHPFSIVYPERSSLAI